MKIRVTGITGPNKDELGRACEFYLSKLMPKANLSKLDVNVKVVRSITRESKREAAGEGAIYNLEDTRKRPTKFQIQLKKSLIVKMLQALAHESVHLRQLHTGKLAHVGETALWKGMENQSGYFSSPWEKEAYRIEGGLFFSYMEAHYS